MNTSRDVSRAGTLIVLVHLAVVSAHGSGHTHLGIAMRVWQSAFIAIVILIAPLLAMILLWTRLQRAGVYVLGMSMAGSLVFGVYYHFLLASADNVFTLGQQAWTGEFRITAVLLAVIEAVGCVWSVWAATSPAKHVLQ